MDIFESVTDSADLDAVLTIAALTNPRLTPTVGLIAAIPPGDRVTGPGAAFVMAAFAYPGDDKRFNDAAAGAYYAAQTLDTSIAEVAFHTARFAAKTPTPPMDFDKRIIEADIAGAFHDISTVPPSDPVYDPDPAHYAAARSLARTVRSGGGAGIFYRSVRDPKGRCVAVFVPRFVANAHTAGYVGLRWDGRQIVDSYRKESLTTAYPDQPA